MQSKMIFKDRIDRLSTEVWLNNNLNMVCGVIFFPEILHFRFPHSIVTIRGKTCEITHLSYDEFSDQFCAVGKGAEYIWKLSELPPLKWFLIICGFANSIAKVM